MAFQNRIAQTYLPESSYRPDPSALGRQSPTGAGGRTGRPRHNPVCSPQAEVGMPKASSDTERRHCGRMLGERARADVLLSCPRFLSDVYGAHDHHWRAALQAIVVAFAAFQPCLCKAATTTPYLKLHLWYFSFVNSPFTIESRPCKLFSTATLDSGPPMIQ